jgi:hypothetical protein
MRNPFYEIKKAFKKSKKPLVYTIILGAMIIVFVLVTALSTFDFDPRDEASVQNRNLLEISTTRNRIIQNLNATLDSIYTNSLGNIYENIENQNRGKSLLEIEDLKALELCTSTTKLPVISPVNQNQTVLTLNNCPAGPILTANRYLRNYLNSGNQNERAVLRTKATASYYLQLVYLDMETTGAEHDLISGIRINANQDLWKKRDSLFSTRYLQDSSGFFWSLGIGLSTGLLERQFCTPLEGPYDPGRNCKTIDMYQRLRFVMSAIASKIANEWMIRPDGSVRTEYWNHDAYEANLLQGAPYIVQNNTAYDPARGIGFPDLLGRRTSSRIAHSQGMDPYFFTWTMSGLTHTAKLASTGNDRYKDIYDFAINAAAYGYAIDPNNPNGNTILNDYGYPVRGLYNNCIGGNTNLNARNSRDICTGSKNEFFSYRRGLNEPPCIICLGYNGQHLGILMAAANWNTYNNYTFNNALNFYEIYMSTTSVDGVSLINSSNGGFNQEFFTRNFPNLIKNSCRDLSRNETFEFYRDPATNRVLQFTGELASELLITAIPAYASIIEQRDPAKALELWREMENYVQIIRNNPLRPSENQCGGGNWIGGPNNTSLLFHYNNLTFAYLQLLRLNLNAPSGTVTYADPLSRNVRSITSSNPTLVSQSNLRKQFNVAVLPDNINWGNWSSVDLVQAGFNRNSLPLDTRVVFKAPDGNWFDSVTKGNLGWNRIDRNYSTLPTRPFNPNTGINMSNAGYPNRVERIDTRVIYRDFDGTFTESITVGNNGFFRRIPTWFNPGPWQSVPNLQTPQTGFPRELSNATARTTYIADNGVMVDIWVKDGFLWYRTYNRYYRDSAFVRLSLRSLGLPEEAVSGIDTITVFKEDSGRWVMSVTKGSKAWNRFSR